MMPLAAGLMISSGVAHLVLAAGSRIARWSGLYDDGLDPLSR